MRPTCHIWNDSTLKIFVPCYSKNNIVVLGCAFCIFFFFFAYFGFFCSVNHLSKTHIYLHKFKRSWFVIHDWWISIHFVCFAFQGLLLCDRPVSGNNRPVKFALHISKIFLILVTCKNKVTSASFLRPKIHSPSRFPSLFLSSLESFAAKLGEHVTLWFALTPPSLKWLTEQKNAKSLLSLQNAQRETTNFVVSLT